MATWDNQEKVGVLQGGWLMNEANLELNQETDPDSGNIVRLNGFGTATSWTNQSES